MTVLLEVRTEQGTKRRCDAACHYAARDKCECICKGTFHGIRSDVDHLTWEQLDEVRQSVELGEGETVQLRFGA